MELSKPVSLSTAVRHRDLLGGVVAWRPAQLEILDQWSGPGSLFLLSASRQGGKSLMTQAAAVANAALRPDLDEILPAGKVRSIPIVCPSESQARDSAQGCGAFVEGSAALAEYAEVRVGEVLFRLPRVDQHGRRYTARVAIRAMPASAPTIRGLSSSLVLLDEFAHHGDSGGPADERRIWESVAPMTTAFGSLAKVIGVSTPFGESGLFYELFQAVEGGLMPHARAVKRTVHQMLRVDEEWLQARRVELGEAAFAQEYLAEFVGSGGSFFDLSGLVFEDAPARPGDLRNVVVGLDPAFHADSFGVAVLGESDTERGVFRVGEVAAIHPGGRLRSLDLRRGREDKTLSKVWELIRPYHEKGGVRIVTDQHMADAVSSYFGRMGVPVKTVSLTGPLQTAAFTSLRTRMVDGSLRLWRQDGEPNGALLIEELRRIRARDSEKIYIPRFGDSHGDIASALALAAYEVRFLTGVEQTVRMPARGLTACPLSELSF